MSELCFSVSSACEKHILITLKWIIVTHDHAANQFTALLGISNLGYLMPDLRVSAMKKRDLAFLEKSGQIWT